MTLPTSNLKVAIMASGSGSNAENLLCHAQNKKNYSIDCIITDKEEAGVIARCEKYGIDCYIVPIKKNSKTESFVEAKKRQEEKIFNILKDKGIDWILLAGYMRILSPNFIQKFWDSSSQKSKIINIHPSLLPQFPGNQAYEQAFESGVEVSGITVHHVDSGVDTGPIILQEEFQRLAGDSFETFKARGMQIEYKLYKKAVDHLFDMESYHE